ncbi:PREDICTED: rho GTPase-activating protein 7 isoform X2 [Tarenaya hassleriana]|nr:PREDICTED: rho GTPase-activating protein 7 isoform X2 [Tarenaya hassleriana]
MLCLRSEALDDDQALPSSSSSPSTDRSNSNGGFLLPMNWGSSISRFLGRTRKGSRRSYSSGDGSLYFPDLEENEMLDRRSEGKEGIKSKRQYRYELEQDVKKLQKQLQEEINLQLALTSAVEHSDSPFLESPCKLPDKAQELLDSLAVLEITVSKLEQESVSLRYLLSQEKSERRLVEFRRKKSPNSVLPMFSDALNPSSK